MPVKVRCPGCEAVLNAPDRARGKAIKCPKCATAVRVPAEAVAKKKAAAPPPSSSMLIANLDLNRLHDHETRICPKCGAEVTDEDVDCPECHVNLDTGVLSAEKKADLSRKGPNPKLYYKEFVRDGIEFWKKNKRLSFRLMWLSASFTAVFVACAAGAIWAAKPPIRIFFMFCGMIAILMPPGLAWQLHIVIIDATLRKKKKLGKFNFDKFLGTALGLKLVFWFLEIVAPLHILAIVFLVLRFWMVSAALEVSAVIFASLLFPIAMSHMAMPVTKDGWLLHKMSAPFFRTIPAILYWCLFLYLTLIPPIACAAVGAVVSGKNLVEMVETTNDNSKIVMAKITVENLGRNEAPSPEVTRLSQLDEFPLNWSALVVPGITLITAAALFGLTSVFCMRTNGLFTYYFLDRLALETMEPETKYVPKAKNLDELEARKGLEMKTVVFAIGLAFALGFALGGSLGMTAGYGFLRGAVMGMVVVGALTSVAGYFWIMIEAFTDSMGWFGAILLTGGFAGAIYGMLNWSRCKFPVVVLLSGYVYALLGSALLIATGASE